MPLSTRDLDDCAGVVARPLPFAAGKWLNSRIDAGSHMPQAVYIPTRPGPIEVRRYDEQVNIAPFVRPPGSLGTENHAETHRQAAIAQGLEIALNAGHNCVSNHCTPPREESTAAGRAVAPFGRYTETRPGPRRPCTRR